MRKNLPASTLRARYVDSDANDFYVSVRTRAREEQRDQGMGGSTNRKIIICSWRIPVNNAATTRPIENSCRA